MSGFEIAGVILGAIPIIISAIDSYKKTTSQRVKWFRSKEPYIAQLIESLEEQRFLLESDIIVTLRRSTDLEFDEISARLQCPNSGLFEDVDDSVREYLGDGYIHYNGAIDRCRRILESIAKDINGLSCSQATLPAVVQAHPAKDGEYEFTKKIKFSLKKDELESRIAELNEATTILRRVRDTSVSRTELTVESTSRTVAKFTAALNVVRDHAHRLYSAISCAYTSCHPKHETRLYLESRSALMKKNKSLKKEPVVFTMAFPHEKPTPSNPPGGTLSCFEAEIKVLDEEIGQCDLRTRAVTIIVPAASKMKRAPSDIRDLCGSLRQARDEQIVLDLYLSQRGCLCYHQLPCEPGVSQVTQNPHEMVSLHQFLQESSCQNRPARLWPLKQRMTLAFNVASSLVQLNLTPWLYAPLTSKSICFVQGKEPTVETATTAPLIIDTPKPFIVHSFSVGSAGFPSICSPKRSLLELGIVLLELWYVKPIETYASEAGLKLSDSFGSRYDVAKGWLESDVDMLSFYLDLVTRCVECTFATSGPMPDWEDVVFRKSLCEYVMQPLWENCLAERRKGV